MIFFLCDVFANFSILRGIFRHPQYGTDSTLVNDYDSLTATTSRLHAIHSMVPGMYFPLRIEAEKGGSRILLDLVLQNIVLRV